MKILFNVSPATRPVTGIGTYAKELINHLLEIDKQNHYTLFSIKSPFSGRRLPFSYPKSENVSYKSIIFPYRYFNILWNNLKLFPVEKFFGKADLVHSLDKRAPFTKKAKVIISVHDMSWYISEYNCEKKGLAGKQIMETLKRSDGIIVFSEFIKNEIIKYFPFIREKIHVIHSGVSERFRFIDKKFIPEQINKKYPWNNFIFYIGLLDDPRKNLIRLISAYAALKKKKKIKQKLVLCGQLYKPMRNDLLRFLRKVNLPDDIIIYTKWIPDEEIPYLYNKAKLVLFPSLYEGFGFPILESMACGTPVITSNISPMKEIADDAALLIDPKNEKELADSIEMILSDAALYNALVRKGLDRRTKFTWKKTAHETLKLYEQCVG